MMNLLHFLKGFAKTKLIQLVLQWIGIKGRYKVTIIDSTSAESRRLQDQISFLKSKGKDVSELIKKLFSLYTKESFEFTNIVPNVGLAAIAENIVTASPASQYALQATYVGIGTGTTSPATGDTTLETEVFRNNVDTQSRSGVVAKNAILIGYSDANGNTLAEVGLFCGDASGTADSGTLLSRALLSTTIVKDVSKSVFIEITHTFSDA